MNDTSTLPAFFGQLLAEQYDEENARRILDGCMAQRAVTLRANTLRTTRDEVTRALDDAGIAWRSIGWYEDAFALERAREDAVRALDLYNGGGIYLQSLSSMIPALVLAAQAGDDVCDMCAAPGGKTTQIAALSDGKALITACEMHAPRAERLEYNLKRQGAKNVNVMRVDARRIDDFFSFDRILLDAPCSGSGTLRANDPKMPKRFTPTLIEKSRKSQRALLSKALNLLKPGGTLVYSTCSVLACENEHIVEEALRAASKRGSFGLKPVTLPNASNLPTLPTSLEGCLALCPNELYEGFFIARIIRTA